MMAIGYKAAPFESPSGAIRYAGLIGAGIAELLHLKYLAPASVGDFFEGVQGSGMRRLMRQGA